MTRLPVRSPFGPTIVTDRLILRPPLAQDFEAFCAFCADEATMRYLGGVASPADVWRTLRSLVGAWALDGFAMFSVLERASGDWIGRVGPIFPHGWPAREVGWGLASAYLGRGYAKEAAFACMDYAFDHLGWDRVVHSIDAANKASVRLAECLGSKPTGPGRLPEPYADMPIEIWSQSKSEWLGNRQRLVPTGAHDEDF